MTSSRDRDVDQVRGVGRDTVEPPSCDDRPHPRTVSRHASHPRSERHDGFDADFCRPDSVARADSVEKRTRAHEIKSGVGPRVSGGARGQMSHPDVGAERLGDPDRRVEASDRQ